MKIFVTSDLHGNRALVNRLIGIESKAEAIIICGDIGRKNVEQMTLKSFSQQQKSDADFLNDTLNKMKIPGRFILGNDDWFEYNGEQYLDKSETIMGIDFIPFEHVAITPFSTNREVNEYKMNYELSKLSVNDNSVIVAHTPPFGSGDLLNTGERCGSKAIKHWINIYQPKIWLNGHIHENNSINYISNTLVINCSCDHRSKKLNGYVIDTETLNAEFIEI